MKRFGNIIDDGSRKSRNPKKKIKRIRFRKPSKETLQTVILIGIMTAVAATSIWRGLELTELRKKPPKIWTQTVVVKEVRLGQIGFPFKTSDRLVVSFPDGREVVIPPPTGLKVAQLKQFEGKELRLQITKMADGRYLYNVMNISDVLK